MLLGSNFSSAAHSLHLCLCVQISKHGNHSSTNRTNTYWFTGLLWGLNELEGTIGTQKHYHVKMLSILWNAKKNIKFEAASPLTQYITWSQSLKLSELHLSHLQKWDADCRGSFPGLSQETSNGPQGMLTTLWKLKSAEHYHVGVNYHHQLSASQK